MKEDGTLRLIERQWQLRPPACDDDMDHGGFVHSLGYEKLCSVFALLAAAGPLALAVMAAELLLDRLLLRKQGRAHAQRGSARLKACAEKLRRLLKEKDLRPEEVSLALLEQMLKMAKGEK